MGRSVKLCFSLALLFLVADLALSADSPAPAPSPPEGEILHPTASPPDSPASPPSPVGPPPSGAPASQPTVAPVPSPSQSSPPAPPPSQENDASPSRTPAPEPSFGDEDLKASDTHPKESDSASGLKGGQKAGIAIGVILGAGIVGLGGFVYKKRRDNIRRSQYGYAARRELL